MTDNETPPTPPGRAVPPPPPAPAAEPAPESRVESAAPAAPPMAQPGAASTGPVVPSAPSPLATMLSSMSQAEKLILGGALLLVLVDLIFSIIIQQYGFSTVIWAAAAGALLVAFARRAMPNAVPFRYESALLVLAVVAVLVGVRQIVGDLLFFLRPPIGADAADLLGLLGLAAGVAAMGFGGWLLWKGTPAR